MSLTNEIIDDEVLDKKKKLEMEEKLKREKEMSDLAQAAVKAREVQSVSENPLIDEIEQSSSPEQIAGGGTSISDPQEKPIVDIPTADKAEDVAENIVKEDNSNGEVLKNVTNAGGKTEEEVKQNATPDKQYSKEYVNDELGERVYDIITQEYSADIEYEEFKKKFLQDDKGLRRAFDLFYEKTPWPDEKTANEEFNQFKLNMRKIPQNDDVQEGGANKTGTQEDAPVVSVDDALAMFQFSKKERETYQASKKDGASMAALSVRLNLAKKALEKSLNEEGIDAKAQKKKEDNESSQLTEEERIRKELLQTATQEPESIKQSFNSDAFEERVAVQSKRSFQIQQYITQLEKDILIEEKQNKHYDKVRDNIKESNIELTDYMDGEKSRTIQLMDDDWSKDLLNREFLIDQEISSFEADKNIRIKNIGEEKYNEQLKTLQDKKKEVVDEWFGPINKKLSDLKSDMQDKDNTSEDIAEYKKYIKIYEGLKKNLILENPEESVSGMMEAFNDNSKVVMSEIYSKIENDFPEASNKEKFELVFVSYKERILEGLNEIGWLKEETLENGKTVKRIEYPTSLGVRNTLGIDSIFGIPIDKGRFSLTDKEKETLDNILALNVLIPVFVANRATRDVDGFWDGLSSSFKGFLAPDVEKATSTLEQTRLGKLNQMIQELDVPGVDEEVVSAISEGAAPQGLNTAVENGKMLGMVGALMAEMMVTRGVGGVLKFTGGGVFRALEKSSRVIRAGSNQFRKTYRAGKAVAIAKNRTGVRLYRSFKNNTWFGRNLENAVREGINFELTGELFQTNEEEFNFLSGFAGKFIAGIPEGAVGKVGQMAYQGLVSQFGGQAPRILRNLMKISKFGLTTGSRGLGEVGEEMMQEVIGEWRNTDGHADFFNTLVETVGTLSKDEKFLTETFVMGFMMGGAFKPFQTAYTKYKKKNGKSPAVEQMAKEFIGGANTEMSSVMNAEEAGAEVVQGEGGLKTPSQRTSDLGRQLDNVNLSEEELGSVINEDSDLDSVDSEISKKVNETLGEEKVARIEELKKKREKLLSGETVEGVTDELSAIQDVNGELEQLIREKFDIREDISSEAPQTTYEKAQSDSDIEQGDVISIPKVEGTFDNAVILSVNENGSLTVMLNGSKKVLSKPFVEKFKALEGFELYKQKTTGVSKKAESVEEVEQEEEQEFFTQEDFDNAQVQIDELTAKRDAITEGFENLSQEEKVAAEKEIRELSIEIEKLNELVQEGSNVFETKQEEDIDEDQQTMEESVGKKVLWQGAGYTLTREGERYVLTQGNRIVDLPADPTTTLESLGIRVKIDKSKTSKEEKAVTVESVEENTAVIDGVTYDIETNEDGQVVSLKEQGGRSKKIRDEKTLVDVEIARNRNDYKEARDSDQNTEEEVKKAWDNDKDVAAVDGVLNKNMNTTVDSAIDKLYEEKQLSDSEVLAVNLWVGDAIANMTEEIAKSPSEAKQNVLENLEVLQTVLFNNYEAQIDKNVDVDVDTKKTKPAKKQRTKLTKTGSEGKVTKVNKKPVTKKAKEEKKDKPVGKPKAKAGKTSKTFVKKVDNISESVEEVENLINEVPDSHPFVKEFGKKALSNLLKGITALYDGKVEAVRSSKGSNVLAEVNEDGTLNTKSGAWNVLMDLQRKSTESGGTKNVHDAQIIEIRNKLASILFDAKKAFESKSSFKESAKSKKKSKVLTKEQKERARAKREVDALNRKQIEEANKELLKRLKENPKVRDNDKKIKELKEEKKKVEDEGVQVFKDGGNPKSQQNKAKEIQQEINKLEAENVLLKDSLQKESSLLKEDFKNNMKIIKQGLSDMSKGANANRKNSGFFGTSQGFAQLVKGVVRVGYGVGRIGLQGVLDIAPYLTSEALNAIFKGLDFLGVKTINALKRLFKWIVGNNYIERRAERRKAIINKNAPTFLNQLSQDTRDTYDSVILEIAKEIQDGIEMAKKFGTDLLTPQEIAKRVREQSVIYKNMKNYGLDDSGDFSIIGAAMIKLSSDINDMTTLEDISEMLAEEANPTSQRHIDILFENRDKLAFSWQERSSLKGKIRDLLYARRGELYGNKVVDDKFVRDMENELSKLERVALTLLVQDEGNIPDKYLKLSKDEKAAVRELMAEFKKDPTSNYRLKRWIPRVRKKYDEYFNSMVGNDQLTADRYISNYMPQFWNLKRFGVGKVAAGIKGTLLKNNPSTKKRYQQSYSEGIKNGLIPVSLDAADIFKTYSNNYHTSLANTHFVESLWGLTSELGQPLAVSYTDKNTIPEGYKIIENPNFHKRTWTGKKANGDPIWTNKPIAVHPDIFGYVNAVADKGYTDKGWKAILNFQNFVKRMQLSMGMFHHWALAETMFATPKGMQNSLAMFSPTKILNEYWSGKGVPDIFKDMQITQEALGDGLEIGTSPDISRETLNGINNSIADWLDNPVFFGKKVDIGGKRSIVYKDKNGQLKTIHMNPVAGMQKIVDKWDGFLWDYLHNGYKITAYSTAMKDFELKNPNATEEQRRAAGKVFAQSVNDTFGGQAWDLLGVSKSQKQSLQLMFLSPDWTISTGRQFMNMFAGFSQSKTFRAIAGDGSMSKPGQSSISEFIDKASLKNLDTAKNVQNPEEARKMGMKFWAGFAFKNYLMMNVLNYAMTSLFGDDDDEGKGKIMMDNDKGNKLALFYGRGQGSGQKIYIRMFKQFTEIPEFIEDPWGRMGSKASPMGRILTGIISPTTEFEPDRTEGEAILEAFLPFALNTFTEKHEDMGVSEKTWRLAFQMRKGYTNDKFRNEIIEAFEEDESLEHFGELFLDGKNSNLPIKREFFGTFNQLKGMLQQELKREKGIRGRDVEGRKSKVRFFKNEYNRKEYLALLKKMVAKFQLIKDNYSLD